MTDEAFTIIDDGHAIETRASLGTGTVRLSAAALQRALGWEFGPEGLCRESLCVPVPPGVALANDDGVDLAGLAAVLQRPLAVDLEERAAYLGASARERADALASLRAPDFALPDLGGRVHSLAEQRGKKVLLVAYASW